MRKIVRRVVPTVAAIAVVALTLSLGNWQTRRAQEKQLLQQQREAADRSAPARVPPVLLADADVQALEGRRASVTGELLADRSVYIDNRTHGGIAGFHLVTPIKIAGSGGQGARPVHVLVLRGWIARDPHERTRLPVAPAPAGPVTVTGIAQRELAQALELAASAPPGPEQRIWQNLTVAGYRRWSGLDLQPMLIRQTEPARGPEGDFDDGLVRDWPRPGLDVDKHRGYAFQWYALAAATAALWIWFVVWRPLRRRAGAAGRGN
ncbi:SURF1 family protein [Zeimonas arvi]|uniref:SURF1 family protein n=1 Tax=Zeimonas arvi TaxID=2498847 RepID=UPI001650B4E9|nr:SURF1 family protein [Zeimonas arvi]